MIRTLERTDPFDHAGNIPFGDPLLESIVHRGVLPVGMTGLQLGLVLAVEIAGGLGTDQEGFAGPVDLGDTRPHGSAQGIAIETG